MFKYYISNYKFCLKANNDVEWGVNDSMEAKKEIDKIVADHKLTPEESQKLEQSLNVLKIAKQEATGEAIKSKTRLLEIANKTILDILKSPDWLLVSRDTSLKSIEIVL